MADDILSDEDLLFKQCEFELYSKMLEAENQGNSIDVDLYRHEILRRIEKAKNESTYSNLNLNNTFNLISKEIENFDQSVSLLNSSCDVWTYVSTFMKNIIDVCHRDNCSEEKQNRIIRKSMLYVSAILVNELSKKNI